MRDLAPTWLCPAPGDRARLLEVDQRLRPAQVPFWLAMAVALLAFVPRHGVLPLAPLVLAAIVGGPVRNALVGRVTPEYVIAGVAVFAQLMLGIGIAMTGGALSPALPVMLVAATLVPARFSGRGMWVLIGVAASTMVISAVAADPALAAARPELLVATLCGMLGMTPLVAALTGSDRQHRAEATQDALTGLPNRRALETQFVELAQHAQARGARLALMACDIDHFKTVNDTHGHVRGDRVLQAFAEQLTCAAREGDVVCRWGGEEFVVLSVVPHAPAARQAADRLRASVARNGCDGLPLTISVGVHLVEPRTELQAAFDAADAALYRAKALGRNRVELSDAELGDDQCGGELIALRDERTGPEARGGADSRAQRAAG